jgi:hypothetical protein
VTREVEKCTLDAIGEEEVRWHKEAPRGKRIIISFFKRNKIINYRQAFEHQ